MEKGCKVIPFSFTRLTIINFFPEYMDELKLKFKEKSDALKNEMRAVLKEHGSRKVGRLASHRSLAA